MKESTQTSVNRSKTNLTLGYNSESSESMSCTVNITNLNGKVGFINFQNRRSEMAEIHLHHRLEEKKTVAIKERMKKGF